MQISRRDLFRSSAVVGGVAAIGGLGIADAAVAGTRATRRHGDAVLGHTTRVNTLGKGPAGAGGYRPVVTKPGEKSVVRSEVGAKPQSGRAGRRTALVAFGQMSDVHICDSESPNRVENGETFSSSAWRPNEILGLHVADAMVQQLNEIGTGPITKRDLDFVLQTGDNADNAQFNEVRWNIDVLDGGLVQQDSGDHTKTENVMDSSDVNHYVVNYWHPEGPAAEQAVDNYQAQYGFQPIPGLLEASRRAFQATGLSVPWYSALGNHDQLVQGNEAPDASSQAKAVGNKKSFSVTRPPQTVTPDPDRRQLTTAEIVEQHFTVVETSPGPVGHGFTEENLAEGTGYYTFDHGDLRFVVMDTVNHNGDDKGCLDPVQFAWIRQVLADSADKLLIFASHHTSWTMTSEVTGDASPGERIHGDKLVALLVKHKNVIAWVNGHTHSNRLLAHPLKKKVNGKKKVVGGFWEINTASHIDWPQQARLIEVANNNDGTLSIFTTMLDHGAPTAYENLDEPIQLAALGRELALNDPQERGRSRGGAVGDRNTELLLKAPAFLN